MAEAPMFKVVDHCRVSPKKSRQSSSSSPSITLNLSPFDIPWCFIMGDAANQIKQILFYQLPNSDFIHQQVLPSLKTSFSLALENFYPYASKLVFPPFSEKAQILYTDGDSVPFTVSESTMDFGELIGDQVKDARLFHPLIPNLSPKIEPLKDDGTWIVPDLLAIQVTIFPDSGLCIGIHYNHTVGDATSIKNFLKSWASICRTGSADSSVVPFLNRDVIEDAIGVQTTQVWKEWSQAFPITHNKSPAIPPSKALRATFILSKSNINRLKEWILNHDQQPTLVSSKISSFAAACAFTWVCYVKSTQHGESDDVMSSLGGGESGDIVQLHDFIFSADVRNRLKTPIPETYLGNCLVSCIVRIDNKVLLGQHGIVFAANAISEKVKELKDDCAAERTFKTSVSKLKALQIERLMRVGGSPRQAVYDTDFGWGRPKKCEMVHIDARADISLAETKNEEGGGLEIGVALESVAMDKFTALFHSFI